MPYFITDKSPDCSGWATVKEDGEVLGCHNSKQDAIDQMIAISIGEGLEPGGERALPDNYRPALSPDVPEGRACGNCHYYNEDMIQEDGRELKAYCMKWDAYVLGGWYCNAWQPHDEEYEHEEMRQVSLEVPTYIPKSHPKSTRTLSGNVVSIQGMEELVDTRRITSNDFELRQDQNGDGMSFTGYAAVFNSPSEPLPFIERIMPGAFSKTLKSRNNVRMYMNHDSSMLLATTKAKTLRLSEDSKGLLVDASLPDTSVGRDLSVLMKRGDVNSMSFGFSVPTGGDYFSDDGMTRELRQIKLFEVSVVTGFPAYTATSASVRSLDALSVRTGIDADQLAAAITNLESGQTLSNDHAMLLRETVAKLEPIQEAAPSRLGIMAKHLDLLKTIA